MRLSLMRRVFTPKFKQYCIQFKSWTCCVQVVRKYCLLLGSQEINRSPTGSVECVVTELAMVASYAVPDGIGYTTHWTAPGQSQCAGSRSVGGEQLTLKRAGNNCQWPAGSVCRCHDHETFRVRHALYRSRIFKNVLQGWFT
jgi:hypothetical protein